VFNKYKEQEHAVKLIDWWMDNIDCVPPLRIKK